MPQLTVLMPVYNAMPYLPMAVESVLAQTLSAFELLIVDDGSTDGTCAYLESLRDARIKFVRGRHEGLGPTLNAGLNLCSTEYIARMDGDDVMHPRRLEAQLEFLIQHPDICMVGCQAEFLVNVPTGLVARVPTEHNEIVERLLAAKSGLCHPAVMMRSSVIRRIGGYRIAGAGEDIDFCLRMCEAGQAANLAEIFYYYRISPGSASLGRRLEIRLGYAYAVESANCRRKGSPEPNFESFRTTWNRRNAIRRLVDVLENWATCEYRLSIIDRAETRPIRGYIRLLTAAAAQPHWCVWRLKRLLRKVPHSLKLRFRASQTSSDRNTGIDQISSVSKKSRTVQ
jgi:glycosyltransferase involved in cell wall biosynthesis